MIRRCCAHRAPRRYFASGIFDTILKPEPRDLGKVDSRVHEQLSPRGYMRLLASGTPEDVDLMLGPKRVRNTPMETVMRMMADHFLMYDAMDRAAVDEDLKTSFGDPDAVLSSSNETTLLEDIDARTAQAMVKRTSFKDYAQHIREGGHTQLSSSQVMKDELVQALDHMPSDDLAQLSQLLMKCNEAPDISELNSLIRKLKATGHRRAAQIAVDCLVASEIKLDPETFELAVSLAVEVGSGKRLYQFVRCLQELLVTDKLDRRMSSIEMEQWVTRPAIDRKLRARFFHERHCIANNINAFQRIYYGIIQGAKSFKWYNRVDTALTSMAQQRIPFTAPVLTLNLQVAQKTNDLERLKWTWDKIEKEIIPNQQQIDRKLWAAALNAARTVDSPNLLQSIERAKHAYTLSKTDCT